MSTAGLMVWASCIGWLTMCRSFAQNNAFMPADTAGGYHLVWSDEFEREGPPDTAAWHAEQGFVRNHEWQWYQQENAFCKNGLLIIEGRRETKPNPWYAAGSSDWKKNRPYIHYTASSINTAGRHAWTYGRFVMRGKIAIDAGVWPAWWTLGVHGSWPANGEIDIMEYYRNRLLANIACQGTGGKTQWYSKTIAANSLGGSAWASRFHIWRMDWDEKAIALYVDDRLLNRVEMDRLQNQDGTGINPFQQPHYMLLNLAIGGDNGGDPSATAFPSRFEIDYVRVYQR